MKNFTKLRIALTMALVVIGMGTALAQTNPLPIPTGSLYKQGTNVADPTGLLPAAAGETPDLVTKGTQVPYLVIPDPLYTPGWVTAAAGNATLSGGTTSTWTWSVPNTLSSTFSATSNTGHYVLIDVDGTPSATVRTINVKEKNALSCEDSDGGTSIDVKIVAQPNATAITVKDGDGDDKTCVGGTIPLNIALPTFNITSVIDPLIPGTDKGIKVKASLVFTDFVTGTVKTILSNDILNVSSSGDISNTDISAKAVINNVVNPFTDLDNWGTYVLTITKISDKISRKDMDSTRAGYFNVSTPLTATYTVNKAAKTGVIYHLPNN